jgi:hypothetical protein
MADETISIKGFLPEANRARQRASAKGFISSVNNCLKIPVKAYLEFTAKPRSIKMRLEEKQMEKPRPVDFLGMLWMPPS